MTLADSVRKSLKETLRDMGLDYVDLYLFPADRLSYLREGWRVLEQLLDEGLVRAIGVYTSKLDMLQRLLEVCQVRVAAPAARRILQAVVGSGQLRVEAPGGLLWAVGVYTSTCCSACWRSTRCASRRLQPAGSCRQWWDQGGSWSRPLEACCGRAGCTPASWACCGACR